MAPSTAGAFSWAPVHSGDFPDPDVMQWPGGVIGGADYQAGYYAFATQSTPLDGGSQINIQVSFSSDGETWNTMGTDALPDSGLGSWAEPGNTWAPSVAFYQAPTQGGVTPPPVFVMYYTATERSTGDQCIGMATAATPFGPYQDNESHRCVCNDGVELEQLRREHRSRHLHRPLHSGLIPDLEERRDHLVPPDSTIIWSAPLSQNLKNVTGNPVMLMHDDESWQSGIVEGPDMYDNQVTQGSGSNATTTDNYYLFYAGSDEGANTYAIGWATCPGPQGPCLDSQTDNPLITTQPGVSGPGGPDIYTLPPTQGNTSGQAVLAFAGWEGTTIGYLQCGIRPMYTADLAFVGGPNGTSGAPFIQPVNDTAAAVGPTCPGPPRRHPAIGRSPRTAGSSPSAAPTSTDRPAPSS